MQTKTIIRALREIEKENMKREKGNKNDKKVYYQDNKVYKSGLIVSVEREWFNNSQISWLYSLYGLINDCHLASMHIYHFAVMHELQA